MESPERRMSSLQLHRVSAARFARYRPGLGALLRDAVAQGASVGFLANLDELQVERYLDEVLAAVGQGHLLLWVAVENEQLLACVQLNLCQKANGRNRAEVQKLLVLHPQQRRGLGQRLMAAVEQAARRHGRGLLFLDTQAGSTAETFYQALGYSRAGEVPDYACSPDGELHPTALYFKRLPGPGA